MAITFSTLQALSATASQTSGQTRVYGLYTNTPTKSDTTSALFGKSEPKAPTLSATQKDTITKLQDFVKENVTGKQADALLEDIAGLEQLMKAGNSSSSFNALSQLLGGNTTLASSLGNGSLINQLV